MQQERSMSRGHFLLRYSSLLLIAACSMSSMQFVKMQTIRNKIKNMSSFTSAISCNAITKKEIFIWAYNFRDFSQKCLGSVGLGFSLRWDIIVGECDHLFLTAFCVAEVREGMYSSWIPFKVMLPMAQKNRNILHSDKTQFNISSFTASTFTAIHRK